MHELARDAYFEGLNVDLVFEEAKPTLGDLLPLIGLASTQFAPTGRFPLSNLGALSLDLIDDYFGIRSDSRLGDDVVLWLYPLIGAEPVTQHPGPFDGLRLSYSVLRNPKENFPQFLEVLENLATTLPGVLRYESRGNQELSLPDMSELLKKDFKKIKSRWKLRNITLGSSAALNVEF